MDRNQDDGSQVDWTQRFTPTELRAKAGIQTSLSLFLLSKAEKSCLCLKETRESVKRSKENGLVIKTRLNRMKSSVILNFLWRQRTGSEGKIGDAARPCGTTWVLALGSGLSSSQSPVSAPPATQRLEHAVPSLLLHPASLTSSGKPCLGPQPNSTCSRCAVVEEGPLLRAPAQFILMDPLVWVSVCPNETLHWAGVGTV